MKKYVPWIIVVAVVGTIATCAALWSGSPKTGKSDYKLAKIKRGDVVETIGATGTVEPEDLIDVGAQVAGRIVDFGKDTAGSEIDYGSEVKAGMVLARIDNTVYLAETEQAEAKLSSALAGLERAKSDLMQLRAKHGQAQNDWERAKKLGPSDALSLSTYDGYRFAAEIAEANLETGKAAIKQAQASIVQARADLNRTRQNLSYCTISSPVDGIIIDRRVNIGQTVVASLNAPSLFLIAKDLKRVQVWVAVNEADIGSIHPGQKVTFTVDAYPDDQFRGHVGKIRLNAGMTQNVVTYTVEVVTDNSDGRLLPYLTANMQFETARADDVLIVPNQALRWSPSEDKPSEKAALPGQGKPESSRETPDSRTRTGESGKKSIWVLDGDALRQVQVAPGVTNGMETAISGTGVREGMEVVTGIQDESAVSGKSKGSTNPFVPQLPQRGKHRG